MNPKIPSHLKNNLQLKTQGGIYSLEHLYGKENKNKNDKQKATLTPTQAVESAFLHVVIAV